MKGHFMEINYKLLEDSKNIILKHNQFLALVGTHKSLEKIDSILSGNPKKGTTLQEKIMNYKPVGRIEDKKVTI